MRTSRTQKILICRLAGAEFLRRQTSYIHSLISSFIWCSWNANGMLGCQLTFLAVMYGRWRRNRKCCQLYFLFFRFCEGSVFARACSSDLSLSVKFSVDFKAEVQEHFLHPLLSLHQIQVDGAWLPYHGYLHRRSCRLNYWKRFQISNCNNSYNCQATTTKNIFNHICTCIISR